MNRFVRLLLAQPAYVVVMVLALIGFGARAVMQLSIEAFPDVQDTQVLVVTQYPGMAPEEVERTVTLPIERELSGVPRKTQMRSVTITGLSVVTLTFADGTNDYFARQQVLEKLAGVDLPDGTRSFLGPLATAVGEVVRYVVTGPKDMPDYEVRAIQDWMLVPELRAVPGVADVPSTGGSIKEYQVQVDPRQLRRYGLTVDQVAQALTNNSANVGAGVVKRGDMSLNVRGIGLVMSLEDIGRIVVASKEGRPVLISDVATVQVGNKPRAGVAAANEFDGVVEGVVVMVRGSNASEVIELVDAKLAELRKKLPPGVQITETYKRSELVKHTVHTVAENLMVGAGLVVAILLAFLRNLRAALIVASVIPLALISAFIMMDARGIPANLISLGAVDFGIIIDSAVVLVEAVMVRLALSADDRHNVVGETVVQLGRPILFSKAIIILAFLPIFTFQRVEGKIFAPVAFTLSMALLAAVVLTVTWVPVLLQMAVHRGNMAEKHSKWMDRMQDGYRRLIEWADVRRWPVLIGSSAMLAAALASAPMLGTEFLPKLDEGNIWLTVLLPTSSSLDKSVEVEHRIREIVRSYPEVKAVVSRVGRPDDGTDPKGPNSIEILADLKPHDEWKMKDKQELIDSMSERIHEIPGVTTNFSQVIQDNVEESLSGVKGEIAIKVFGPDLRVLAEKSEQIESIVSSIRGAEDVAALPLFGQNELDVQIDRAAIARLGLDVNAVNGALVTAVGGRQVSTFFEGSRKFDITVRFSREFRQTAEEIASVPVPLPDNAGSVTLGDVAKIQMRAGASAIAREGGQRNGAVKTNIAGRDQGSFVEEAQRKVAEQVKLPPGYYITWGGQFENQQRAVKRLAIIVPISVLMIFSLLFWAFRSVRWAALVLLLVPPTAIGGIAGLALAGLHFSVSAAVGFIAVAGIAVQNGVIMVEEMLAKRRDGITPLQQAIDGAVSRLRPVLMTALMAGLGLLPAALSHAIGSETQRPFAIVVVGGIVSATLFTLVLLPLLFPFFAAHAPEPLTDEVLDRGFGDGHPHDGAHPV